MAIRFLLVGVIVGGVSCSSVGLRSPGGGPFELEEWQGQVVELNRERGYIVVRSQERLLDHVFRITPETEITSQGSLPSPLEPGRWVAVQYQRVKSKERPPAALRLVVIR
jgi:hypothetical protein